MPERCICCGEVIPEGRMVCYACEHSIEFDGIKYYKSPIIKEKSKAGKEEGK